MLVGDVAEDVRGFLIADEVELDERRIIDLAELAHDIGLPDLSGPGQKQCFAGGVVVKSPEFRFDFSFKHGNSPC